MRATSGGSLDPRVPSTPPPRGRGVRADPRCPWRDSRGACSTARLQRRTRARGGGSGSQAHCNCSATRRGSARPDWARFVLAARSRARLRGPLSFRRSHTSNQRSQPNRRLRGKTGRDADQVKRAQNDASIPILTSTRTGRWRSSQLTDVVHERSPPGRCSVACRSRWNQVEHRVAWFTSASASEEVYRLARRLSARAGQQCGECLYDQSSVLWPCPSSSAPEVYNGIGTDEDIGGDCQRLGVGPGVEQPVGGGACPERRAELGG